MFRSMWISPLVVLVAGCRRRDYLPRDGHRSSSSRNDIRLRTGVAGINGRRFADHTGIAHHACIGISGRVSWLDPAPLDLPRRAMCVICTHAPIRPFVYWMLVLYWLTLFAMCGVFISRLRTPARPMETLPH